MVSTGRFKEHATTVATKQTAPGPCARLIPNPLPTLFFDTESVYGKFLKKSLIKTVTANSLGRAFKLIKLPSNNLRKVTSERERKTNTYKDYDGRKISRLDFLKKVSFFKDVNFYTLT